MKRTLLIPAVVSCLFLIQSAIVYAQALSNPAVPITKWTSVAGKAFDYSLTSDGDKSVVSGASVSNTITTTIVSGATQNVTVRFNIPRNPGITISPNTLSLTPTQSGNVTFSLPASVPPGSYNVTVTADAAPASIECTSEQLDQDISGRLSGHSTDLICISGDVELDSKIQAWPPVDPSYFTPALTIICGDNNSKLISKTNPGPDQDDQFSCLTGKEHTTSFNITTVSPPTPVTVKASAPPCSATGSDTGIINLAYSGGNGATSFKLYRKTSDTTPYDFIGSYPTLSSLPKSQKLNPGQIYYYQVESINASGDAYSNKTSAVANASCSSVKPTPNIIAWQLSCVASPSTTSTGKPVLWNSVIKNDSGPFTYVWNGSDGLVGSSDSVSMSYLSVGDKSANMNVKNLKDGSTKNASCAMTVEGDPAKNLSATPGTCLLNNANSVSLSWQGPANNEAIGYTIYRNGNQLASIVGAANHSYVDNTVSPITTYAYAVAANYIGGSSVVTSPANVTTVSCSVAPPPSTGGNPPPVSPPVGPQPPPQAPISLSCAPYAIPYKVGNSPITFARKGQQVIWVADPSNLSGYSWTDENGVKLGSRSSLAETYQSTTTIHRSVSVDGTKADCSPLRVLNFQYQEF